MSSFHTYQTRSVTAAANATSRAQPPPRQGQSSTTATTDGRGGRGGGGRGGGGRSEGQAGRERGRRDETRSLCPSCGALSNTHSSSDCVIAQFRPKNQLNSIHNLTSKKARLFISNVNEEKIFILCNDSKVSLSQMKHYNVALKDLPVEIDEVFTANVRAKVDKHFISTHSDVIWSIQSSEQREQYLHWVVKNFQHEYLLYQHLQSELIPSTSSTHSTAALPLSIRMSENVCFQHQLGNSIVAFFGTMAVLENIVRTYHQDTSAHPDRVPYLHVISLSDILQHCRSEKDCKKYFHRQLHLAEEQKVKIKYHLMEVL